MVKILILTFYYEPDLCAGSFRNTALIRMLDKNIPEDISIDVFTTMPNRYATFKQQALEKEVKGRLTINRIVLNSHQSGMLDQSKAFLIFAKKVLSLIRDENYDFIYASSSRLMTAFLAAFIAKTKKIKTLYLDIRDIFVDTITEVLPRRIRWLAYLIFTPIERFTIKQAAKVNLVSGGFIPYFIERYPELKYSLFTNGIDDEFISSKPSRQSKCSNALPEVLYAGNIGEGQGLHNILPMLAKKFEGKLLFKVVGAGGRLIELEKTIENSRCTNIELINPVDRKTLIGMYEEADILFLHLNDYEAFKKVLPSKLFEYAATGKPIWAGVGGYAARFVKENIANAVVFNPGDVKSAIDAFGKLALYTKPRPDFISKYASSKIMEEMAKDIMSFIIADNKAFI